MYPHVIRDLHQYSPFPINGRSLEVVSIYLSSLSLSQDNLILQTRDLFTTFRGAGEPLKNIFMF